MAVRIRMKKLGRKHRPFFRICAMDSRAPRDGRVIEELGYYDPMVPETDARVVMDRERVAYWLGVGAQPTPKVSVLIRKYGNGGTHVNENAAALQRLAEARQARAPLAAALGLKPAEPQKPAPAAEPVGASAEGGSEGGE